VPQDYKEALKWCRLVADQGDASAQSNLGWMYKNGEGVPQDYIIAYMWFNLAAANGSENAPNNRDTVAKKLTQVDLAKAQELSRACLANDYKNCGF
jgi:TPR repeat protein